jgi:transcriptional regulator GlxA family with amidase domain
MDAPRRIVIVGFDDAQSLDFVGPLEVFATAERLSPGRYSTELRAPGKEPFASHSGIQFTPDGALASCRGPVDTLIVAGGVGVERATSDAAFLAAIRSVSDRSRRVASVCTGAFALAAAGLLNGCRVTTHWAGGSLLAERYPALTVEPDRIYVRDGRIWTSAGVTAGMDLALALVEEDLGREAALEVARWLVMYAQRSGSQAQFSEPLAAQLADREPIREAQERVVADPAQPHTVEMLADAAGMTVRSFARAFKREVGITPAAYVETVRVDRARQMLETSSTDTVAIAERCGFGTVETFRRAFRRRLGVSPGEYRDRFRAAA